MRGNAQDVAEILNHLRMVADIESGARAFATFVLKHGREWNSAVFDLPSGKGLPRACYHNCQALLFSDMRRRHPVGFVYVEGYACSAAVGFPFVTEHAWLVDVAGNVVDPTWEDPEHSAYFGVPFRGEYVRSVVDTFGACAMIDNFHNRWELVRLAETAGAAVLDWGRPTDRERSAPAQT
jgi:hypothetical protein